MQGEEAATGPHPASAGWIAGGVFLLFTIWSGSFLAFEVLLAPLEGEAPFDWLSLTAARYVPVALLSALYCVAFRWPESRRILRAHWRRLLACGFLIVTMYNFGLMAAQQMRLAAPIASLLTCLTPLLVMVLSVLFLRERVTPRRLLGLLLALTGVVLVAASKDGHAGVSYPWLIALGVCAPLSWSIHTVLTKPLMRTVSPLLWTYLAMAFGGLPFLLVLPFSGGPELLALDGLGWGLLAYLALLCNLVGYALWTWLLVHLPATSVGFTIFLNPPMTTGYKVLLAALFPAAFTVALATGEVVGGLLLLAGVGVAMLEGRTRPAA